MIRQSLPWAIKCQNPKIERKKFWLIKNYSSNGYKVEYTELLRESCGCKCVEHTYPFGKYSKWITGGNISFRYYPNNNEMFNSEQLALREIKRLLEEQFLRIKTELDKIDAQIIIK